MLGGLEARIGVAAVTAGSIALAGCSDEVVSDFESADLGIDGGVPPFDAGSCQGPRVPSLIPTEVDFGLVSLGQRAERPVFINNSGSCPVTVLDVSPGARFDQGFDFEYDRDDAEIGPNGALSMTVSFEPATLGPRIGALLIRTDARDPAGAPIILELSVRAVGAVSSVVVDPDTVSFGNVIVGTTKTLPIQLRNDSDIDVTVEIRAAMNVRLCSDVADLAAFCIRLSDRPIRSSLTFDLRARESTLLELEFTPTTAGVRQTGTFVLRGCTSAACNVVVRLDGVGVESGFQCAPSGLDFGMVSVGGCSTQTVSCTNVTSEPVVVVSWGGSSQTSADFSFETPRVTVVDPNDAVDVDVTYCPTNLGQAEGTLVIQTDSTSAATVEVPLTGTSG